MILNSFFGCLISLYSSIKVTDLLSAPIYHSNLIVPVSLSPYTYVDAFLVQNFQYQWEYILLPSLKYALYDYAYHLISFSHFIQLRITHAKLISSARARFFSVCQKSIYVEKNYVLHLGSLCLIKSILLPLKSTAAFVPFF